MKINEIPRDHAFEGYLWLSNAKEPIILENQPIPENLIFSDQTNPFIVEAELWDITKSKSYAIHQAGNETVVNTFDVKPEDFNNNDIDEVVYASHRMGNRHLHFLEYWEARPNEATLGMPTLVMTKRVFVGFKVKEDKL